MSTEKETEKEIKKVNEKKRERKIPAKFDDYVMLTYKEAIEGKDGKNWLKAIKEEKDALEKNEVWEYVDKKEAEGERILSSKWVFKIKDDGRYKARLVVRGCQQQYGIHYEETFSPVINITSLRILFGIAAKRNYKIKKFDIKTAFLNGKLDKKIYMMPPEGYNVENKVCVLKKALYGLKQAPLKWNKRIVEFLKDEGLVPLKLEKCIFVNEDRSIILAVYVDDGLLLSNEEKKIDDILTKLKREFEIV